MWSRILESSPKISKILATMNHYKKIFVMRHFFKKSSDRANLPMNNKNLCLWKSLVSAKIKVRSSYLQFPQQNISLRKIFIFFILIFSWKTCRFRMQSLLVVTDLLFSKTATLIEIRKPAYQRVRNVRLSENLACFVFL